MNMHFKRWQNTAFLFVFLSVSIAIGAWLSKENVEEVVHESQLQIIEQQAIMYELAERTDRNEGDEVVNAIIKDCTSREEFEQLLNNIGALSRPELLALENHYENCASFYAERKAFMVARLERELSVLMQYNSFLLKVAPKHALRNELELWQSLVSLEKNRSEGLNEQVRIQKEVISALLAGGDVSLNIRPLLQEAQALGERLEVAGAQIDALRLSLSKV